MIELPQSPGFDLSGKRALVTGGTSGIGLACTAALAQAGAEVTVAARTPASVDATVSAVIAAGGRAHPLPLDIADIEATASAVAAQGPFDILINSAGTARHSPAIDTVAEDFDAVFAVNVRAAYFLTRNVAVGLIDAKRPGSLINISSQMASVGGIDRAAYCASKHAVEGFTKAMAIEWGAQRIRVNTICPTFIRTPLTEPTFANPQRVKWIEEKIKLGRVGEMEDIMGAAVYLASDASALVTGTALLVDGGWTAD